ncbi:MAG: OPT/YSL family transporter [Myxococcota bacterium]|nr:OPT/YSL family transporter [Myxococcota bacterium]
MPLFQKPPRSAEEIARSRPLHIAPEEVARLDEREWYARAFRGDVAQLTVRAVAMGSVLGFFLAFTNVYVTLKAGWLLGVALTACIASFTIWSSLQKLGLAKSPMTILENNCMQSTASAAGYATSVMVGSAVPAMLMLSVSDEHPKGANLAWWILAPWMLSVATLGVMVAIPMKRNMINHERLRFPSGTAAAVLLQSLYTEGREALAKGRALLFSALVAVLVPLLKDLNVRKVYQGNRLVGREGLLPAQSKIFDWLPPMRVSLLDADLNTLVSRTTLVSEWGMVLDHGIVLVGAGAIVGLRTTLAMALGGLLLAFGIGPLALEWTWTNAAGHLVAAARGPASAWKDIGTWFGAPLLVSFGLVSFGLQFRTIVHAFSSIGNQRPAGAEDPAGGVEVPMRWFAVGGSAAAAAVVILAWLAFDIPIFYGALAVVLTLFLAVVACRATGETDITPGGPMGKVMQLAYGILMPQSYAANLMTASITAGAGLASADLLNDLKSGYLLGAHPRRQFVAQFLGIFTGTVATCIAYYVLVPDAAVLTGTANRPAAFPAPAAQQWRVVAELFKLGVGNLHPFARHGIAIGICVGTVLAFAEWAMPNRRRWIPSATGLGLGLLLPLFTSLSFLVGALVAWLFVRIRPREAERFIVPIASGLIAGESILGVVVAILNTTVLK